MTKKKELLNIVFLIIVFALTMHIVFYDQDLKQTIQYIQDANVLYWIVAVFCVVGFIITESIIILYMFKSIGQKVKITHCFLYSFIGFFFSGITPGASGGQPMQLLYMKKDKIPVSISTLILLIITITYKLVLVVIGGLVFLFRPASIMKYLDPILGWCYFGMFLNTAAVIIMLLLVFHPTLAANIMNILMNIITKLKIFRNIEKLQNRLNNSIKQYQDVSQYFWNNKIVVINVFLITFVQRILLFFVLYLTYVSFGFSDLPATVLVSLQGMISVAADMLPLPGGVGITEKLFIDMFTPVFHDMTLAVMVVSRGLSYYTQLLISAVFTGIAYFKIGKN